MFIEIGEHVGRFDSAPIGVGPNVSRSAPNAAPNLSNIRRALIASSFALILGFASTAACHAASQSALPGKFTGDALDRTLKILITRAFVSKYLGIAGDAYFVHESCVDNPTTRDLIRLGQPSVRFWPYACEPVVLVGVSGQRSPRQTSVEFPAIADWQEIMPTVLAILRGANLGNLQISARRGSELTRDVIHRWPTKDGRPAFQFQGYPFLENLFDEDGHRKEHGARLRDAYRNPEWSATERDGIVTVIIRGNG